jgi:hypothetical protein
MPKNPTMKVIALEFTTRLIKSESLRKKMQKALTGNGTGDPDPDTQLAKLIQQTLKLPNPISLAGMFNFRAEMQALSTELVATEQFLRNLGGASFFTNV